VCERERERAIVCARILYRYMRMGISMLISHIRDIGHYLA